MDIRKWLDETVLPQQPPSPVQALPARPKQSRRPPKQRKKKRKHSTTDSSILPVPPKPQTVASRNSSDQSSDGDASEPSSPDSSSSSQPYARRPRRKTRPDRYEPKENISKERSRHGRRHAKGESPEPKRKSKRKKVVTKQGTTVDQTFQAKNVSKDRLTLQPRAKPGLFNKGRASSAVKGRGLPDLVFSEMKFLQAQRGQAQPCPSPEPAKKKRSKDRPHADEEISAYFAAVRPALAEKDVNTQAKGGTRREKQRDVGLGEEPPMSAVDNAIPTVESKGTLSYRASRSRDGRHRSESYMSWSDSIPAPGHLPPHRRMAPESNVDPQEPMPKRNSAQASASRERFQNAAFSVENRGGGDVQLRTSSAAPAANGHTSRSCSLPQRTSSPRHGDLNDHIAKRRALSSFASPLSKRSLVPNHRSLSNQSRAARADTTVISTGTPRLRRSDAAQFGSDLARADEHIGSDEINLQNASSVERLILDRNTNFNEMQAPSNIPIRGRARALEPLSNTRQTPTVRFGSVEEIRRPRALFSAPSIYQHQERWPWFTQRAESRSFAGLQELYLDQGEHFDDEEEMGYTGEDWEQQGPTSYEADFMETENNLEEAREVSETHGIEDASTVAMDGFWRRHRLY